MFTFTSVKGGQHNLDESVQYLNILGGMSEIPGVVDNELSMGSYLYAQHLKPGVYYAHSLLRRAATLTAQRPLLLSRRFSFRFWHKFAD